MLSPHTVTPDCWPRRIGPYVLLELRDGGCSCRTVHGSTEAKNNRQVWVPCTLQCGQLLLEEGVEEELHS